MRITKDISYIYMCDVCKKKEASLPPDPLFAAHHMPDGWIKKDSYQGGTHYCSDTCQGMAWKKKEDEKDKARQKIIKVKAKGLDEVKHILANTYDKFDTPSLEIMHLRTVEEMIHHAIWGYNECEEVCTNYD